MKAPLWQYLIPKYGNFGGPGWSGGKMVSDYNEVDWNIKPIDSLDKLFYDHDRRYQDAIKKKDSGRYNRLEKNLLWLEADDILIGELKKLATDPKYWNKKPPNFVYGWFYRRLALYSFIIKVWLYRFKYKKPELT